MVTFNCLHCGASVTVRDINKSDGLCESCDGHLEPVPVTVKVVWATAKEGRDALLKEVAPTPEQTAAAHKFFDKPPTPPAVWGEWAQLKAWEIMQSPFIGTQCGLLQLDIQCALIEAMRFAKEN